MNLFSHGLVIIAIFGAIFALTMIMEHRIRIKAGKPGYDILETLANMISAVLYKVTDVAVAALLLWLITPLVHKYLSFNIQWSYGFLTYVGLFFVVDLLFWNFHRLAHKHRLLWTTHKIHHSSRHYNFGVALRQSLLFPLLGGAFFLVWLPMLILNVDIKTTIFLYELNLLYQYFLHTEVVKKLPSWFEAVFNTPSHHRVHHGIGDKQIDCNYGGTFIIFDRLFGTFVPEEQAGEIVYGVKSRPVDGYNPIYLIFEEVWDLFQTIRRTGTYRHLWAHPDTPVDLEAFVAVGSR